MQFTTQKGHFTSPNQQTAPSTPYPYRDLDPSAPLTAQIEHVWSAPAFPYHALLIRSPFFGAAMGQFSLHDTEKVQARWHMPRHIAEGWKKQEQAFCKVASALESYITSLFANAARQWQIPGEPSQHGYSDSYHCQQSASNAIQESVAAFAIYSAYISFLIVIGTSIIYPNDDFQLAHVHDLFQHAKCSAHPQWIDGILDSGIGNLSKGQRRGVVVDVRSCPWLAILPILSTLKADIPIWFYWGHPPFPTIPSTIATKAIPRPDGEKTAVPHDQSLTPQTRGIQNDCGQMPKETWRDFCQGREALQEARLEKTTIQQEEMCLSHQSHAQRCLQPECPGSAVYRWIGKRQATFGTCVNGGLVGDMRAGYRKKQEVFDAVENCRGCCTQFGSVGSNELGGCGDVSTLPIELPIVLGSKRMHEHMDPGDVCDILLQPSLVTEKHSRQYPLHPTPSCPTISPRPTACRDITFPRSQDACGSGSIHGVEVEVEQGLSLFSKEVASNSRPPSNPADLPVIIPAHEDSIQSLLFYKYGYSPDTPFPNSAPLFQPVPALEKWNAAVRAVGGVGLPSSDDNDRTVRDFLHALHQAKNPFHEVPAHFWDLSPWNSHALHKRNVNLRVQPTCLSSQDTHYLIHPVVQLDDDVQWRVLVSPSSALECLRRNITSTIELANFLLGCMMPFRTVLFVPAFSPRSLSPSFLKETCLLGERPADHHFGIADFVAYETLRDAYIREHAWTRHALCRGGIIARLASITQSGGSVLEGPTRSAVSGEFFTCEIDGGVLVDDDLPEQVIDFICGTYRVKTRTGKTALVSWFPRENVWDSSGISSGRWHQTSEEWYLARRTAILEGKAQPQPSNEWRKALRFTRHTQKLWFQTEMASRAFLDSTLSSSLIYLPQTRQSHHPEMDVDA